MMNFSCAQARVATALFLMLARVAAAQADDLDPTQNAVKLEPGRVIEFALETPLDSARAKVGDEIAFKLVRPFMVGQFTIAPPGWILHGRVTKVRRAGKNCKSGRMEWKLEALILPNSKPIKVQSIHSSGAAPRGIVLNRVSARFHQGKSGESCHRDPS